MNFSNYTKNLFPYQIELLKDNSKYIALEKSRRIGGTWIFALKCIIESLKNNWDCWFSSNDEKNSKEFIRYVREWCDVINIDFETIHGYKYIDTELATSECVILPNKKRISSLSSAPNALRAKDGIIVLDEMAHRDDQEELYTAAQGCIIQKGKIYILSSHNGPATVFYKLINDKSKGYSRHKVTIEDAIKQGYAVRFAKELKHLLPDVEALNKAYLDEIKAGALSEEKFNQEFMCMPVSLSSLVSPEAYDALAISPVPEFLEDRKYNNLYCGLDVGRVNDLTVLWIIEEFPNDKPIGEWDKYDFYTVCVKSIKNQDIPTQMQMLRPIISHPSIKECLVDQGTIGRSLSDALCSEYPHSCRPFSFNLPQKAVLAERVAGFVQHKKISLPKDDWIKEDIISVRREANQFGNVRYEGSTAFSHCDHFWSLAMALQCASERNGLTVIGLY